ncbi:hypothetical protein [Nannocystis radixulma]|uniref:Uncharacterized protein n=1 Tax=Nannocystis radixulma TaxID=2995305 RepID=A0ABT5BH52_9BACT|nr:hypothetical protein [Nannocystis radixulma]MDC0673023.1 hypothetical protein [Nannocystis radixulma]
MVRYSLPLALCFACAPNQPDPPRMIVAKPVLEDIQEPAPVEPAPPPAASPAVPAPELPSWWCTCYARTDGTAMTACRGDRDACYALSGKARQAGGDGIAPVSLTHDCREVSGEHPGDVLGGRDRWQPSKKPGAWIAAGACLFSEPPDAVMSIADIETFAGVRRGMLARDVVARLGESGPKTDGWDDIPNWATQTWPYPDHDLVLTMARPPGRGGWIVDEIVVGPASDLRTGRGIGAGSTRAEVVAAYAADFRVEVDEGEEPPAAELASAAAEAELGSDIFIGYWNFGGLHFTFDRETDKVIGIRIRGAVC